MSVKILDSVMQLFAQKRLSPEQPVLVVVATDSIVLLAKTTLRELSDQYHVSMFEPDACDLGNPMIMLVTVTQYNGSEHFVPMVMTVQQYEKEYGPVPTEVSTDED